MGINEKELLSNIQIVSYHDGFARKVAEMWNRSKDAWGGVTRTEEQIIEQHQSSDNIDTFLAVDNGEVVGYCGLSVYKEDIGSLYVPLLNVIPEYHGKKVGKLLLLRALEVARDKKWPRLDLYTWPGNTKAVPLYKRCGFFWEDNDSYTHLMNFIPTVINDNLLTSYMKNIDWYQHMIKHIEVKPDGVLENGFTFYEYVWKNKEEEVKVKFEKTGRGISFIETKDFVMELSLSHHELTEETEQKFRWYVKNKMEKPLVIQVNAINEERFQSNYEHTLIVETEAEISPSFYINDGEDPVIGKTHPAFTVNVNLNGMLTTMKLGLFPKAPLTIKTKAPEHYLGLGMKTFLDLELENNLDDGTEITYQLPVNDYLHFESYEGSFRLKGKEREFLRIPAKVKQIGCFKEKIVWEMKRNNQTPITLNKEVTVALKGIGERFFSESKQYWYIYNGIYQVNVRKSDNVMTAGRSFKESQSLGIFAPIIGKPFSNEISKKKPHKVTAINEDTAIILQLCYSSTDFEKMELQLNIKLYPEGLVKRWITIKNGQSDAKLVSLQETFYHDWINLYIPIKGKVACFNELNVVEPSDLTSKDISGNWYFSDEKPNPIGVYWSEKSVAKMEGWKIHIESVYEIEAMQQFDFPPLCVSIGAFIHWEEVEVAANGIAVTQNAILEEELNVAINDGNIVWKKNSPSIMVECKTNKNKEIEGSLKLQYHNNEHIKKIHIQKDAFHTAIDVNSKLFTPITKISAVLNTDKNDSYFRDVLFVPQGEIKQTISLEENQQVYTLSNGVLEMKVSPSYYPGLYSLKGDTDWLAHSFPKALPKSWWNPWGGGIKMGPPNFTVHSHVKEQIIAEFVDVNDKWGNRWSGIKITSDIKHHVQWKGLVYNQYYLTLPGVPVLVMFVEILEDGGKRMREDEWQTISFLVREDKYSCVLHTHPAKSNHQKCYKAASEEQSIHFDDDCFITQDSTEEFFHFIASRNTKDTEYYSNKDVIQLVSSENILLKNDKAGYTKPSFIVLDKEKLPQEIYDKIRRIEFY